MMIVNILPIRRPHNLLKPGGHYVDDTITTIYCLLCDEFLKAIDHRDDPQLRLTTAEVMSVPLVATTFSSGATSTRLAASSTNTATCPP
jgi:hypothetical protein